MGAEQRSYELLWIMKNFNRRDSHGHHGSKRHELAHLHGLKAIFSVLPWRPGLQLLYNFSVSECEIPDDHQRVTLLLTLP